MMKEEPKYDGPMGIFTDMDKTDLEYFRKKMITPMNYADEMEEIHMFLTVVEHNGHKLKVVLEDTSPPRLCQISVSKGTDWNAASSYLQERWNLSLTLSVHLLVMWMKNYEGCTATD